MTSGVVLAFAGDDKDKLGREGILRIFGCALAFWTATHALGEHWTSPRLNRNVFCRWSTPPFATSSLDVQHHRVGNSSERCAAEPVVPRVFVPQMFLVSMA